MYYMGSDHIVFGSDSLWYGGPRWQIEALWRFQIPDQIADKWQAQPGRPHWRAAGLGPAGCPDGSGAIVAVCGDGPRDRPRDRGKPFSSAQSL
jgi:hypothetical protein